MRKRYATAFLGFLCVLGLLAFVARKPVANGLVSAGDRFFGPEGTYSLPGAFVGYRAALFLDPDSLTARHQLARIHFLRGQFDRALSLIDEQIRIHGHSFMASYYIRGLIHGYRKAFPEAERDFREFLTWDPENWAALNDLAWIYFAQGKFAEAKETAARGLAIVPENPWLLTMHAMSTFNLGEAGAAADELRRAKAHAADLREEDWIRAYPGNDPRIASAGLASLRGAIEENIVRVNRELAKAADTLYLE